MGKSYQVYILKNASNLRYIGLSEDPHNRLEQHNQGISKWTAKNRPWELSWISRPLSLTDARKLENLMKRQKGGNGLLALMKAKGSFSRNPTREKQTGKPDWSAIPPPKTII